MLKKIRALNIRMVTKRPKIVLLVALLITMVSAGLASTLQMELNWVALAPAEDPAVKEYQEILESFPTLENMIVVVESNDERQLEVVVNEVARRLLENKDYIANVTTGIERDFMIDNAMLYVDTDEIEAMSYMFLDGNLDSFYAMMAMNLTAMKEMYDNGDMDKDAFEAQLVTLKNLPYLLELQKKLEAGDKVTKEEVTDALERIFAGNGLVTSKDGKMAMISVMPNFDMMDIEKLEPGVEFVEGVVESLNEDFEGVTVNVTGMHVVARDETASIESDSQLTTLLSLALILIILYVVFRSFAAPLLAFVPLIFGIVWSMGLAAVTIGRLNMMTAFSAAMLLGLGIDYAIHLYSSYTEKRTKGLSKEESLHYAIEISGPGIVTGALTTAVAFYALNVSQLELLSELGTIMGTGILTTLVAVFWILPALIQLKKEKEAKVAKMKGEFTWIGVTASLVHRFKVAIVPVMILLLIFMGYKAQDISFDSNLLNLEPEGLKSIEVMDYLVEKYDMSSNSFNLQVDSLEKVYTLQEQLSEVDGVYEVTSVAAVLPEASVQKERLEAIREAKGMMAMRMDYRGMDQTMLGMSVEMLDDSLATLSGGLDYNNFEQFSVEDMNEIRTSMRSFEEALTKTEASQMDDFGQLFFESYNDLADRMMTDEIMTVDNLPSAFKEQFVSADGSKYMVTIVPDFDVWANLQSEKGIQFFDDLKAIDDSVTGTPIFMKVLYDSVSEELVMTGLVLLGILVAILMIHFKSFKYTLLALLPLIFTLTFMVGIMVLTKQQFNMLNFLSVLLVIGIGIDDGVHILHHYKEGQRDIAKLFASVGRAISLTTMTTVFGFGSLMFSSYRGIATLGKTLSIGVTLAFIMTVVILPIFLKNESEEVPATSMKTFASKSTVSA